MDEINWKRKVIFLKIKLFVMVFSLIMAFVSIIFILISFFIFPKLGLFGLAFTMLFAMISMIAGGFVSSRFGSSVDYKDNKKLVVIGWILYGIITLGFFFIAIYENFIYNG